MSKPVLVPTTRLSLHRIEAGESVTLRGVDSTFTDARSVDTEFRFNAAAAPAAGNVTFGVVRYPRRTGQTVVQTQVDPHQTVAGFATVAADFAAGRVTFADFDIRRMNGIEITNGLDVAITNVSVELIVLSQDVQQNPTATESRGCRS